MSKENKTQPTTDDVNAFLETVENPQQKADCQTLLALMSEITGQPAVLWGANMIGFGQYHYRYATGREGNMFMVGFSPRKQNTTLYFSSGAEQFPDLLAKLGKYKTGKSCLYVKKLADVDQAVLEQMIQQSYEYQQQQQA
jgi:hypothetical protein